MLYSLGSAKPIGVAQSGRPLSLIQGRVVPIPWIKSPLLISKHQNPLETLQLKFNYSRLTTLLTLTLTDLALAYDYNNNNTLLTLQERWPWCWWSWCENLEPLFLSLAKTWLPPIPRCCIHPYIAARVESLFLALPQLAACKIYSLTRGPYCTCS